MSSLMTERRAALEAAALKRPFGERAERELRACAMEFAISFLRNVRAMNADEEVVTIEYGIGMMETYVAGARAR